MRVAQRVEEFVKGLAVFFRHLDAHQNAAVVGALVAVMEQADVPARAHQAQELEQRTRPLREHKAQQPLVLRQR